MDRQSLLNLGLRGAKDILEPDGFLLLLTYKICAPREKKSLNRSSKGKPVCSSRKRNCPASFTSRKISSPVGVTIKSKQPNTIPSLAISRRQSSVMWGGKSKGLALISPGALLQSSFPRSVSWDEIFAVKIQWPTMVTLSSNAFEINCW